MKVYKLDASGLRCPEPVLQIAAYTTEMKKGDIVMIYEDPITKQKPEGKARLLELLFDVAFEQEFWRVIFLKDHFVADRWINKDQKPEE